MTCHTCQHLAELVGGHWCRIFRIYVVHIRTEMPCNAWQERVDEVVRRGEPITKHN